jgi:hypothetical protein
MGMEVASGMSLLIIAAVVVIGVAIVLGLMARR